MLTIKDGKKILTTPVSAEDLKDIHIGDVVLPERRPDHLP